MLGMQMILILNVTPKESIDAIMLEKVHVFFQIVAMLINCPEI